MSNRDYLLVHVETREDDRVVDDTYVGMAAVVTAGAVTDFFGLRPGERLDGPEGLAQRLQSLGNHQLSGTEGRGNQRQPEREDLLEVVGGGLQPQHHSPSGVVEVCTLVGYYRLLARLLAAADRDVPDDRDGEDR